MLDSDSTPHQGHAPARIADTSCARDQTYVALNPEVHFNLRFSRSNLCRHMQCIQALLLAKEEIAPAALDHPVVFLRDGEGYVPAAVFGLEHNRNLRVRDGVWIGGYLPAVARAYPFRLSGQTVLIDICAPQFTADGGQPMFDSQGKPTPTLAEQLEFLSNWYVAERDTRCWGTRLAQLELMAPRSLVITCGSDTFELSGAHLVDEQRLGSLSESQLRELLADGTLALLFLHLASLQRIPELAQLHSSTATS